MGTIIEAAIYNFHLLKNIRYQIILPDDYEDSGKFYPVLYLLHGLFGTYKNWTDLTDIKEYAAGKNFIIVFPDAGDSWYTDSATCEAEKAETFFLNDFLPEVENKYRILRRKNARAIAGLSMGGYGALKLALKRPDLFCFSGSMSGAFEAPRQHFESQGIGWNDLGTSISSVFGDRDSSTRMENDLFEIIGRIKDEQISSLAGIYMDCGKDDAFLESNRKLALLLREKGIEFRYREAVGGHDWEYWNRQINEIMNIVEDKFSADDD